MSVKKFKTFEEASKDLWNYFPDSEYYKRIARFYKLAANISRFEIKRGIFKYKTIEEASRKGIKG